jgi:nucleolar protein 9
MDASTNKPDQFQKNTKRQKSAEAMFDGESSSKKLVSETTSTAFLNNTGKKKSPGFLSDKPSSKKQKHQRPNSIQSDGSRFVRDSINTPFVRNTVKQKQSIAELAALAGKDKLTAGEVRKLLKPEISAKN